MPDNLDEDVEDMLHDNDFEEFFDEEDNVANELVDDNNLPGVNNETFQVALNNNQFQGGLVDDIQPTTTTTWATVGNINITNTANIIQLPSNNILSSILKITQSMWENQYFGDPQPPLTYLYDGVQYSYLINHGLHRVINGVRFKLDSNHPLQMDEIPQAQQTEEDFPFEHKMKDGKMVFTRKEIKKYEKLFKEYKMKPVLISDSKILDEFFPVEKPKYHTTGYMGLKFTEEKYIARNPIPGWELSEGKVVFKNKSGNWVGRVTKIYKFNEEVLVNSTYVKIIGYEDSGNIFGYKKLKKEYVAELDDKNIITNPNKYNTVRHLVTSIVRGYKCKKDGVERDCITINHKTLGNLKFLSKDVEIVYPTLPELSFPKEKVIKNNSTVICKNDKYLRIKKGDEVKVIEISKGNNGKIKTLKVQDKDMKIHTVLAKKFKVI